MKKMIPEDFVPFLDALRSEGVGEFWLFNRDSHLLYPNHKPQDWSENSSIGGRNTDSSRRFVKIPVYDTARNLVGFILRKFQESDKESSIETRDYLTGLPDRRALEIEFLRRQGCGSLVLLDLDRFKEINDTLGHQIGDALLALFAGSLQEEVGVEGWLARYGGDEFILLLSGSSLNVGPQKMANLQHQTAKRFAQKLVRLAEKGIKIPEAWPGTFSFGWTPLAPNDTLADTVLRADRLLFQAKHPSQVEKRPQE